MDEWIVADGMGEYVEAYTHVNHIMVFTRSREQARRTTDSREAFEIARLARAIYGRPAMRMQMA